MSNILATEKLEYEASTVEGRISDIIEMDNAEIRIGDYRLSASDRDRVIKALRLVHATREMLEAGKTDAT